MIERTKVEISILYTEEEKTDALIMSEVYKKMGFRIVDFEYPTKHAKGYYIMKMECQDFENVVFSIRNPDDFKPPKKKKR